MSKEVKELAKNFRKKAEDIGVKISHSQSLELLSVSKGFKDWNAYSAFLKSKEEKPEKDNRDEIISDVIKYINSSPKLRDSIIDEVSIKFGIPEDIIDNVLYAVSDEGALYENFYKNLIKQKFNVFLFNINSESFYVIAKSVKDAEDFLRKTEGSHYKINSLEFNSLVDKDKLSMSLTDDPDMTEYLSYLSKKELTTALLASSVY